MKITIEINDRNNTRAKNLVQDLKFMLAKYGTNATIITSQPKPISMIVSKQSFKDDFYRSQYDDEGDSIDEELEKAQSCTCGIDGCNCMSQEHFKDIDSEFRDTKEITCPECNDRKVKHCTTCFGYGKINVKK